MPSTTGICPEKAFAEITPYPLGSVPDDLPETNPALYRQIIAKRMLIAGYESPEEDIQQTISDALADLRHLCDTLGLDFASLDKLAYHSYANEKGVF